MKIVNVHDVKTWEVIGDAQKGVHLIYWLCWLVLFFPALIVVFIYHKKRYPLVELTYSNGGKREIIVPGLDQRDFLNQMERVGAREVIS
ncbi:hypothetical protein MW332_004737 [Vibrio parahaemolyticus]|nr:hypothetical protein [Vibrio parahaemolyticus]